MNKQKINYLAFYLPQYHEIPENNDWWGKGYTEWTAVKNAKKYFSTHNQPRVPLDNNYYDLSDESGKIWKWQARLAKEYGIDGFCIYHYWFDTNDQLLEKPMEILLKHREIEINYCVCWANESWARNWYGLNNVILKEQKYSIESFVAQFNYLLPFFKDDRYIKINNKPLFCIYKSSEISDLGTFVEVWNDLAKQNGFDGIYFVSARTGHKKIDTRSIFFNAYYNFEPGYTLNHRIGFFNKLPSYLRKVAVRLKNKYSQRKSIESIINSHIVFNKMYKKDKNNNGLNVFPGAFVAWDNTPRRSYKGTIYKNTSPLDFEREMSGLGLAKKNGYNLSYVFINAWNEWGEGCYLEPDTINQCDYLSVIRKYSKSL